MRATPSSSPPSPAHRAQDDKQRGAGKTHTQAILRLARRRTNVRYAMLRDGAFYTPRIVGARLG
jgi:hypothetical protein